MESEFLFEIAEPVLQVALHVVVEPGIDNDDLLPGADQRRREDTAVALAYVEKYHLEHPLFLIILFPDREGFLTPFDFRPVSVDIFADPQPIAPEQLLFPGLQVARIVEVDDWALCIAYCCDNDSPNRQDVTRMPDPCLSPKNQNLNSSARCYPLSDERPRSSDQVPPYQASLPALLPHLCQPT